MSRYYVYTSAQFRGFVTERIEVEAASESEAKKLALTQARQQLSGKRSALQKVDLDATWTLDNDPSVIEVES